MGIFCSRHSQNSQLTSKQHVLVEPVAGEAAHDNPIRAAATAASSRDDGREPAKQVASSEPKTPKNVTPVDSHISTPVTPAPLLTDASPENSERKMHKYNSMEKPHRSAMRASDTKSDGFERKSTSGVSSVEFSVGVDAPEAEEHHRTFVGTDSISLKKIVDMFYDKVTADPQLSRFFEGIDLIKLKRHQVRFMALAFGGKELVFQEDPNLNLRKVHYRLIRDEGLDLSHWERFVGLFDDTMEQLEKEIPAETRQAASASIRATRHYFVPIGQETQYTSAPLIEVPDHVDTKEKLLVHNTPSAIAGCGSCDQSSTMRTA